MGVFHQPPDLDDFEAFVERVKPTLLQALVATYGPVDGREATVDALSWAWEHWDRLADVNHPVGYLYRVGQPAPRRFLPRPVPARLAEILETRFPDVEPRAPRRPADAAPAAETVNFQPLSATAPLPVELTAAEQASQSPR